MQITLFSFFFFILLFFFHPVVSLSSDGLALLTLKSAVDGGDTATTFSDWNENDLTPCHWSGISCSNISGEPDSRVVGIGLAGKGLRGYLPSELGNLIYLRRLSLHTNLFHGSIPVQLFNATSLHSIFLHSNNLSGSLSPSVCNVPRLQNLDLSDNSLAGDIPDSIGNCSQLQRLILARNNFSGDIPVTPWKKLKNLVQLDLSANVLEGSIPEQIGELNSLTGTLNLSFNHLSGKVPKSLGKLPVTVSFDLRSNDLSGEIPQTGSFSNQGPTAFLNNPKLCGFPLQNDCTGSAQSEPGASPGSARQRVNRSKKGLSPGLIIIITVADAAAVALIGLVVVYVYWKKKDKNNGCSCTLKRKFGGNGNNERSNSCCLCWTLGCVKGFKSDDSEMEESEKGGREGNGRGEGEGEGELVAIDKGFSFELDELLRASAYVLGKSGLGIVYKVVLGNGVPVAVRRLGEGGEQRYKEFATEVQAIGKVKHPNIVKLRAYYWAHDEKLLISDFVANGNLANALRVGPRIRWLRIAKGTARGLAYLHECSPRKFVHGDLKPSNILLDTDFQPLISDFGLNRLISITGNNPSTGGFMGGALPYMKSSQTERTNNYKAPEAKVPGCRPTQKWDVYSFGVVLLELLTGKSPDSSPGASTSVEVPDLVRWVKKGFEQESPLSEMVDPSLLQEIHAKKEVLAVFHVALSCTEGDPEVRPRMKTVSDNLERI